MGQSKTELRPGRGRAGLNAIVHRLGARAWMVAAMLVAAAALLPAPAKAASGSLTSGDYSGAEGSLHYELYVPSSYQAGSSLPLVVALHGCTQSADQLRQLTHWDALAEAKGFIVLFPQQDAANNPLTCWNFFQDGSMHRGAGDPARIAAVTSVIENTYNVDPHRVYVAGFSAGGAMASVMAATYPDYFAAIGTGSGCEYSAGATCAGYRSADPTAAAQRAHAEMSTRARPIPFIAFQGDADTTVPPANADQLVQQWLMSDDMADDGAANGSISTTAAKSNFGFSQGGATYTTKTYNDAHGAELAQYWVVRGMKHAWSGGDASQSFSYPSGPDETGAMYAFFANHPAPSLTRPAMPARQTQGAAAASKSPKRGATTVSKPKLSHGRIVFRVSGPGSVTLRLKQRVAGHKTHGRCVAGKHKGRACTTYVTRAKIVRKVAKAGLIAIKVPKKVHGHRLPRGRYRAVVTPRDSAGHRARSHALTLRIR